jgi:tetratricopeptide (TPR) repeat protein
MAAPAKKLSDPFDEAMRLSAAGRHAEAIDKFETALQQSPDDPRVLFALGNTARALGLYRPAEGFYRRVLALDSTRLEAIVNLSNLLRSEGNFAGAEAVLLPALARSDAPELQLALGSVYREQGDDVRAERHYRAALAQRADFVPALANLADLIADRGEVDDALALYDRALKRDSGNAQARLNRAVLHLLRGDLKNGWRDYAARLKVPNKVPVAGHGLARWSGGPLKRTRLLVTAEQGVGDQIMLASVIPDLVSRALAQGGTVLLECEPRLVNLFARSFPDATVKAWDIETRNGIAHARYGWLRNAGGANAAIELGSLPRYLRPDFDSFPSLHAYLVPDAQEKARWRAQFENAGSGPYVGICWRSGNLAGHRTLQYAPLKAWGDFLRDVPGTIVCAQYDALAGEVAQLEEMSGRKIFVPSAIDQKNEIDRACAMLSALDVVISAPTAVSWQAAALGVPTGKILYDTSWTSFGQTREPFAPACECLMPDTRGDWASGFAKAKSLINQLNSPV